MTFCLPCVIAIKGRAGAGKSTAANFLVDHYGYRLVKFAGPLKRMLAAVGLTQDEIEGDLKEVPCDLLGGQTPRHAMVTLGTEWGRDLIHPDLWVNLWRREAAKIVASGGRVVADDCRFPNEAAAIRELGGRILEVSRAPSGVMSSHVSENGDFPADAVIENAGEKDRLYLAITMQLKMEALA